MGTILIYINYTGNSFFVTFTSSKINITTFGVDLEAQWLQRCYKFVQFRFIQLEHHGGFCDCWEVANLTVTLASGQSKNLW